MIEIQVHRSKQTFRPVPMSSGNCRFENAKEFPLYALYHPRNFFSTTLLFLA